MNVRKKGMLSLIGAIAVFATASVCFSNCSSEDDFGEMEEMEFTMASKKMTRAGETPSFQGIKVLPGFDVHYVYLGNFYCEIRVTWSAGYTGNYTGNSNCLVSVYPNVIFDNGPDELLLFEYTTAGWNGYQQIEGRIDYSIVNFNSNKNRRGRYDFVINPNYEIDTLNVYP